MHFVLLYLIHTLNNYPITERRCHRLPVFTERLWSFMYPLTKARCLEDNYNTSSNRSRTALNVVSTWMLTRKSSWTRMLLASRGSDRIFGTAEPDREEEDSGRTSTSNPEGKTSDSHSARTRRTVPSRGISLPRSPSPPREKVEASTQTPPGLTERQSQNMVKNDIT